MFDVTLKGRKHLSTERTINGTMISRKSHCHDCGGNDGSILYNRAMITAAQNSTPPEIHGPASPTRAGLITSCR